MAFPLVDQHLEHYELLGGIGSGAMSEVYLGRDIRLDRLVAVKVLSEVIVKKADGIRRFEREAQAAARLEHPNVATVFFSGTHHGKPFYAMEFIRGWSFSELVESRVSFSLDQVLPLFAQACVGLDAAMQSGVTHRDIKPGNLMVTESGMLKVVDFGLARLAEESNRRKRRSIMGTPFYIAPEVIEGSPGDHRSDLYSLGVTFFEILGGAPPFDGDTPHDVLRQHVDQPVPHLSERNPSIPQDLSDLLVSLMDKNPEARPESYTQVHERLRGVAANGNHLSARLRWCSSQRVNTFAEGSDCSLCKRPYDLRTRPESFHVDLVGWKHSDARDKAAHYIARALGHEPETIEPLLDPLPFRAAFRARRERAKRMHREFHELGAEVDLVPADDAEKKGQLPIQRLPVSPHWPQVTSGDSSEEWTRPLNISQRPKGLQPSMLLAALFAVATVVLSLLLADARSDLREFQSASPEPVNSPSAEELLVEEAHSPPPPAGVHAPLEGVQRWEDLVIITGDEEIASVTRERAHRALTQAVSRLTQSLPSLTDFTPVTVILTSRPLWEATDERTWLSSPWAPQLEFPVSGLTQVGDPVAQAAADNLVARTMLRRAVGPSVPGWLLVGLAAHMEQGKMPTGQWAEARAAGGSPRKVSAAPGETALAGEEVCRAFLSFLVDRAGWEKIDAYILALSRSRSPEDAAMKVFGAPLVDLEQEWLTRAKADKAAPSDEAL
ncbi:MAG: serine/threonine-protein kinase [Myxococcota bacterium]|nr:serine/threonine-protein kinase [Myxococcota bacterium]